jgi:hypothetical protein
MSPWNEDRLEDWDLDLYDWMDPSACIGKLTATCLRRFLIGAFNDLCNTARNLLYYLPLLVRTAAAAAGAAAAAAAGRLAAESAASGPERRPSAPAAGSMEGRLCIVTGASGSIGRCDAELEWRHAGRL